MSAALFVGVPAPIAPCSPAKFINKIVEHENVAWLLDGLPGTSYRYRIGLTWLIHFSSFWKNRPSASGVCLHELEGRATRGKVNQALLFLQAKPNHGRVKEGGLLLGGERHPQNQSKVLVPFWPGGRKEEAWKAQSPSPIGEPNKSAKDESQLEHFTTRMTITVMFWRLGLRISTFWRKIKYIPLTLRAVHRPFYTTFRVGHGLDWPVGTVSSNLE